MNYIKREKIETDRLVCNHPRVKKIWEWGGCGMNPTSSMRYYISILLDNDERLDFEELEYNSAVENAEKYLKTI